jgi:multisubunit Na+/H+ antiporter MnhF subunit
MNWIELLYFVGWFVLSPGLVVAVWRIVKGPTTLDRVLGLDLLTITLVALMIVYSIHERTGDYIELILIVAALGFFTTVAFFYYLSQLPATEAELQARKDID